MADTDPFSGLPRVHQSTTVGVVYETIRNGILGGQLPPGEQLREVQLSRRLGTSRAPIREAIGQLVDEGLVDKVPYKGAAVAHISDKAIADIAEVRKLVETSVIESSVATAGVMIRHLLEDALLEMSKAAKYDVMAMSVTAHTEFHAIFYRYCGNQVLQNMWKGWEGHLQLFFSKDHTIFDDLDTVTAEHEHLLEVAFSGDSEALRQAIVRHVHGSVDPTHWTDVPPATLSS